MLSIKKRGDTYRIMMSQDRGNTVGRLRKTTPYTPPEGVTEGRADKLSFPSYG